MLETIGLVSNWSTLSFNSNLCIFAVPENFLVQEPVRYKQWCSWIVRFLLIFCKTLYIFAYVFFIGSILILLNCLVFNISKHFLVYLCLSITATPLPLSCFIIKILSFLERFSKILLYSYGT